MFQISKQLTNSANRRLHKAVIINSEMIEAFILVSFKSDIPGEPLAQGEEVMACIDNEYVGGHILSSVGNMQQLCCALFYLNDRIARNNPAAGFQPGDTFAFNVGSNKPAYDTNVTHHFFVGDESAVGLFYAYKEMALQNNHEYFGVLSLDQDNDVILTSLKLLVDSVPACATQPVQNVIQWMEDMHPHCWMAWQKATFYLAGDAALTEPFYAWLQQKNVSGKQIRLMDSI